MQFLFFLVVILACLISPMAVFKIVLGLFCGCMLVVAVAIALFTDGKESPKD